MILDVERKFDSHLGISAKDQCPCFSFKCFFSKLQEFRLFPGRFLQIYCKELAKLDHAGDNYGEVAEDLCDRLAIPGAMIFDPHVWLLVNRHEQVSSLLE